MQPAERIARAIKTGFLLTLHPSMCLMLRFYEFQAYIFMTRLEFRKLRELIHMLR